MVDVTLSGGQDTAADADLFWDAAGSCQLAEVDYTVNWVPDPSAPWLPPPPTDIESITWAVPPFRTIFKDYYHVQDDRDEIIGWTGPPVTRGEVHPFVAPAPTDKAAAIRFCLGPVETTFSVTATVKLTTGESGSDTQFWSIRELHLTGQSITVPGPDFFHPQDPMTGQPNPNLTVVGVPGAGAVIQAQFELGGPAGWVAFVQKVKILGTFTLNNGDTFVRDTETYRVDVGSTSVGFVPLPPELQAYAFGDGGLCSFATAQNNGTACGFRDGAYVNLEPFAKQVDSTPGLEYAVSGGYNFQAEVWAMFVPPSGEPVPIAKAQWGWSVNFVYDAAAPMSYRFISPPTTTIVGFTATDDWPTWVYDTGDKDGWWVKM
jgi:hypothetical protein